MIISLLNISSFYSDSNSSCPLAIKINIFTCPIDGIYGFYFSIATVNVNEIVAKLVVNSANEVDGVVDTFHTNHEAQGGNFVFVSLTKGQQVWVANYRFSSFSGYLLYWLK